MDSPKKYINTLSICSGLLGIERGLERVIPNLRTVCFLEIEAFIIENLVAEMEASVLDPALIWSDAKTFPAHLFRNIVDILLAGYSCQPFSNAGQRKGADDPRHLWPYIERTIDIIRPAMCLFENVRGHVTLGLREVIASLEGMGYKVHWGIFSAEETGASHKRERVFIMAIREDCLEYASGHGFESNDKVSARRYSIEFTSELADSDNSGERARQREVIGETEAIESKEQWRERHEVLGERMRSKSGYCSVRQMGIELGHTNHSRLQGRNSKVYGKCSYQWTSRANGPFAREHVARPGQPQHAWEEPRTSGYTNRLPSSIRSMWSSSRKNFAKMLGEKVWEETDFRIKAHFKSKMGMSSHEYNFREDVLRALGNSVYQDTAELAFRTLLAKFQ